MRTTSSFQLPGMMAAASLAGILLLTGCSSNGLMIYKNTKHVESVSGVSSSMGRGLFGLKNGSAPKQVKQQNETQPKLVTHLQPAQKNTQGFVPRQPANKTYLIQKGDTLSKIALDHKVGIDELAALNNMHKDGMIRAGEKLTLPYGAVIGRRAPSPKQPAKAAAVQYYTVQNGDYLGKIALKTKTSLADLKAWNGLSSDNIQVGWKLALGAGGSPKITKPGNSNLRGTKEIPADGIHVVKSGDSISKIATMYKGLTSSKLKALNGLSNNRIIPGQTLKLRGNIVDVANRGITTPPVPMPTQPETVAKPTSTNVPPLTLPHFVDQQNDTLKSVAEMYGSKVEWILAKNPGIKTDTDLRGVKEVNIPVME